MPTPTDHQGFVGFPQLGTPFVQADGRIAIPWYKLLVALWQRSGGGNTPVQNSTYVAPIGGGNFAVFNSVTGDNLGTITTVAPTGAPVQVQAVGVSPYVFTSAGIGTLVVESGQVEISRDAGVTWFVLSLAGASVPVLVGDKVRVTYYNVAPKVTFLPTSGL